MGRRGNLISPPEDGIIRERSEACVDGVMTVPWTAGDFEELVDYQCPLTCLCTATRRMRERALAFGPHTSR